MCVRSDTISDAELRPATRDMPPDTPNRRRPLLVLDVHHVAVNVSDLDASSAFYREAFGFATRQRTQFREVLGHGAVEIHLFQAPDAIQSDGGRNWRHLGVQHLAFSVSDDGLERAAAVLAAQGAGADGPVQDEAGTALYTRDPDGNVIELRSRS